MRQTKGIITNDIRKHLGTPCIPQRNITYVGPLDISAQLHIIGDIIDPDIIKTSYMMATPPMTTFHIMYDIKKENLPDELNKPISLMDDKSQRPPMIRKKWPHDIPTIMIGTQYQATIPERA